MNKIEIPLVNIPLGKQAHHLASQFTAEAMELVSESTKKAKGKQVYLNSLAVYAVDSYLQWQGYDTNNSNSDFGNVIVRSRLRNRK